MKKVSIIVRSYNDIDFIEKTMQMIIEQSYKDYEIINVDCSSTDGTLEIIKKYNPNGKIFTIKPEEYVPGKVLNKMIKECDGEIIVFNNSDCTPIDDSWLSELIKSFNNSNTIACFGNQLPRPNARPLIVKDNTRAFGDGSISSTWKHFFSLATSAIRKNILLEYPFNEDIQYSEDIEWSYRLKQLGKEIRYCKNSKVLHSHNYTLKEVKKRFYNEGYAEGAIYKTKTTFLKGFIIPYIMEVLRDIVFLAKSGKFYAVPYGTIYRLLQKYFTYKGRHDFFKGIKIWPSLKQ